MKSMRELIDLVTLNENLGNLNQLGVGWMTDILKQSRGRYKPSVGTQFVRDPKHGRGMGYTSEVVDVGTVKNIAGVRKAMREVEFKEKYASSSGFALYADGDPVLFAQTDADDMRTKKTEVVFAYDLRKYEELIRAKVDRENEEIPSYRRRPHPRPDELITKGEVEDEDYNWRTKEYEKTIRKLAGEESTMANLNEKVGLIFELAKEANHVITMKIVSSDAAGRKRYEDRRTARGFAQDEGLTLMQRLKKYKNSKRPTAKSAQEFIDMVLRKEAKVINFEGIAFRGEPSDSDYKKISPVQMMKGKPFAISYQSADPEHAYGSLDIHYRYTNGQILPWKVTYTQPNHGRDEAIIDREYWFQQEWNVDINNKEDTIRAFLSKMKELPNTSTYRKVMSSTANLIKDGVDWPELKVIYNAAKKELGKTN